MIRFVLNPEIKNLVLVYKNGSFSELIPKTLIPKLRNNEEIILQPNEYYRNHNLFSFDVKELDGLNCEPKLSFSTTEELLIQLATFFFVGPPCDYQLNYNTSEPPRPVEVEVSGV